MCIVLNQFGYRFRNFIAKKLKRAGLAADSGIPTPQFSRTCPGVGLAFLRNRLTSKSDMHEYYYFLNAKSIPSKVLVFWATLCVGDD